jgi:hypothetical protein
MKFEFTEEEIFYFVEAVKRLVEIGQLEEAKKIVKGLLRLGKYDAILETAGFLFLITEEPQKAEHLLDEYVSNRPYLPFHVGIFLILAKVMVGKIKEGERILENLKALHPPSQLSSIELRASNFVQNLLGFVNK